MPRAPGQDPGHGPPVGFTWEDYVDFLVETCGTLAAVAERLASRRGYSDEGLRLRFTLGARLRPS